VRSRELDDGAMDANAIVPERRRQRFPPVEAVHLDEETREAGRRGIDASRRELDAHPGPPRRRRFGRRSRRR
jgi:hypothetical protein